MVNLLEVRLMASRLAVFVEMQGFGERTGAKVRFNCLDK